MMEWAPNGPEAQVLRYADQNLGAGMGIARRLLASSDGEEAGAPQDPPHNENTAVQLQNRSPAACSKQAQGVTGAAGSTSTTSDGSSGEASCSPDAAAEASPPMRTRQRLGSSSVQTRSRSSGAAGRRGTRSQVASPTPAAFPASSYSTPAQRSRPRGSAARCSGAGALASAAFITAPQPVPLLPRPMLRPDGWPSIRSVLDLGSEKPIPLRVCKTPAVTPRQQRPTKTPAPATGARRRLAMIDEEQEEVIDLTEEQQPEPPACKFCACVAEGAVMLPMAQRGAECPGCYGRLQQLSAKVPDEGRIAIRNYRTLVGVHLMAAQPPEGHVTLYALQGGECAAAGCAPLSQEWSDLSPATYSMVQPGRSNDTNMHRIPAATADQCAGLFGRWGVCQRFDNDATTAFRSGIAASLATQGSTINGAPMSEEQAAAGCTSIFVTRLTLVCVPANLAALIDRKNHTWSDGEFSAFSTALLEQRCAFQRTVHLDVSGKTAELAVTAAVPCQVPPHPTYLPIKQLRRREAGNWRPVKLTVKQAPGGSGEGSPGAQEGQGEAADGWHDHFAVAAEEGTVSGMRGQSHQQLAATAAAVEPSNQSSRRGQARGQPTANGASAKQPSQQATLPQHPAAPTKAETAQAQAQAQAQRQAEQQAAGEGREPDLHDLMLAAAGQAAAAAAGLTADLVAVFSALLPLERRQEATLRSLLSQSKFSIVAEFMETALHKVRHKLPGQQ